jgi:hypothetical protein
MATVGDAGAFADYIRAECPDVGVGDVRFELYADFAFIGLYGTALTLALRRWWGRVWETTWFRRLSPFVVWLPIATAVADTFENVFLLLAFRDGDLTDASDSLMGVAGIVGTAKFVLLASSLVALVSTIVGLVVTRKRSSTSPA